MNGTVVLHGRLDRSPCGTGTSARLAVMAARGLIDKGELFTNESITRTKFTSRIVGHTRVGTKDAVIPSIAGQAWITGIMEMGIDPTDPIAYGHKVSDIWF